MAQPTDFQLNFVSDIEAGTRALIAQGTQVTKISQVTDAAGRDLVEVSQFAGRFVDLGHWALIERLAKAFLAVNLTPLSIARALEAMAKHAAKDEAKEIDPEPLELDRHVSLEPIESKALEVQVEVQEMEHRYCPTIPEPEELLCDVIKLISRLPQPLQRRKVAGMAANWFGVGG